MIMLYTSIVFIFNWLDVDGVFSSDSSPALPPPNFDYEEEEEEEEEKEEKKGTNREPKETNEREEIGVVGTDEEEDPFSSSVDSLDGEGFIPPEQVFTPDSPQDRHLSYPSPLLEVPPRPPLDEEEMDSGGSYMSSSEEGGSRTTGEDSNSLEWINNIRLFEYRLSSTEESLLQEEGGERLPYFELIQQLQVWGIHVHLYIVCVYM